MTMRSRFIALFLLTAAWAVPSGAQDRVATVLIQDDVVFLDGRRLAPSEYPANLRTKGQHAQFTLSGNARFYVNGRLYGVDGTRLVEVTDDDDSYVVLFRPRDRFDPFAEYDDAVKFEGPNPTHTIRAFASVLDDRAERIEQLSREAVRLHESDLGLVADRMRRAAEESAVMLRAFPRIEMQSYLTGLQGRDSMLYERLMEELRMEAESARLAASIRASTDAERRTLEATLLERLDHIFELKQQNRRDEIAQLESQLSEMRAELAARESKRRAIIDRRLEELIGPRRR